MLADIGFKIDSLDNEIRAGLVAIKLDRIVQAEVASR